MAEATQRALSQGSAGAMAAARLGPSHITHHVQDYLKVLADLVDNPDDKVGDREAVLTLSVLVGALSIARAVDDPDLSQRILTYVAAALKRSIPT